MKVVILRTDRIGDLVLAEPLIEALHSIYTNICVDVVASEYAAPVLYENPLVSKILALKERNIRCVMSMVEEVSKGGYDISITVDTSPISYLIPFLAGVRIRVGQGRRLWGFTLNKPVFFSRRCSDLHEVILNQLLLKPFGYSPSLVRPRLFLSPVEVENARRMIADFGFEMSKKVIVMHPGSLGSSAEPPFNLYYRLCEMLGSRFQVMVCGQKGVDNLEIFTGIEGVRVIDDMNIREYMGLISQSDLFVGGDTGPMHIASAMNIPVVAIFSPMPDCGPQRWGPLSDRYAVYMPSLSECNGECSRCKLFNCMEKFKIDDIITGVVRLLDN